MILKYVVSGLTLSAKDKTAQLFAALTGPQRIGLAA